jgi:hypothetical protein
VTLRRLSGIAALLLVAATLLAGCGFTTSAAGSTSAIATLQPVAICANPPQDRTTGPYIWAIPAMASSNLNGAAQVCGVGFHLHATITLSLARSSSAAFIPIPNLTVKTDDQGAFSTAIAVDSNWVCLNLRIQAADGEGDSATTRLSPDNGAQPANCPAPPNTP